MWTSVNLVKFVVGIWTRGLSLLSLLSQPQDLGSLFISQEALCIEKKLLYSVTSFIDYCPFTTMK